MSQSFRHKIATFSYIRSYLWLLLGVFFFFTQSMHSTINRPPFTIFFLWNSVVNFDFFFSIPIELPQENEEKVQSHFIKIGRMQFHQNNLRKREEKNHQSLGLHSSIPKAMLGHFLHYDRMVCRRKRKNIHFSGTPWQTTTKNKCEWLYTQFTSKKASILWTSISK